jgi:ribosomal-protein-alanine N-acetyltransferase
MQLTPLSSAFAPLLAVLHAACFSRPWDEAGFAALLASPGAFGFLAAEGDDDPAGFILCRAAADEAELLTLGVRPERRGRGASHLLLAQAVEAARARGVLRMFLEVAVNNVAALTLYRGHDFKRVGMRRKYYSEFINGSEALIDAFVLEKFLEKSLDSFPV